MQTNHNARGIGSFKYRCWCALRQARTTHFGLCSGFAGPRDAYPFPLLDRRSKEQMQAQVRVADADVRRARDLSDELILAHEQAQRDLERMRPYRKAAPYPSARSRRQR